MLDSKTLHLLIKEIYNLKDRQILPITQTWFLPNIKFDSEHETIIGYRIVSKQIAKNHVSEKLKNNNILKVSFRLTFLGKNAEDLCTQILFWNYNYEIKSILDKYNIELACNENMMFSYPIQGKNETAWIFDIAAYTV